MDVNTDLAMWSNQLIISAMIVYAVAMIFYAFDLFGKRELKTSESEITTSAKASTVRRTNRKTATTAVLDRPGDGSTAEPASAPRCSCSPCSSMPAACSPVPCRWLVCRGAT